MKKIISLVLVICIFSLFVTSAVAQTSSICNQSTVGSAELITSEDNTSYYITSNSFTYSTAIHEDNIKLHTGTNYRNPVYKTLRDLNGNTFELVETGDYGYYIFDRMSGVYLEQSTTAPSPYLGKNNSLFYFGPMNYYQKKENIFVHTIDQNYNLYSKTQSDSLQESFDIQLIRNRSNSNNQLVSWINGECGENYSKNTTPLSNGNVVNTYITDSHYISNAVYPPNDSGTCGYTASCILLNYWHQREGNVISPQFLNNNNELLVSGYTLQDKLLEYGNGQDATWGLPIRDVLLDYCNDYGVSATVSYYVSQTNVERSLSANRPVILFGSFTKTPDPVPNGTQARGSVLHAVVAYGTSITYYQYGQSKFYIVHYGWDGYSEVLLPFATIVGSNTQFRLT